MLKKYCFWCAFPVLAWLSVQCATAPPPPRPDIKPGTGGKDTSTIDTTIIPLPDPYPEPNLDTVRVDTLNPRNLDADLGASSRFGTNYVFSAAQLDEKSGNFYRANDFIGRSVNLDYRFVAPRTDTMKHRPFVLMVHEGAFLFGSLENELGKARLLARKGYATASMNYRLGFNGGSEQNACGGNNREVVQAVYRAVQDTYAALHYFAARADELGIDPGQMILAGSSAGAITITAMAYMREVDFESLLPGIVATLGPLDPNPKGAPFRVRALLSYLGYGIFTSNYITQKNALPTIFFQRTGDNVLPYLRGTFLSCPDYLASEGAKPVSDRLRALSTPFELNYQPERGHQLSYTEEYITNRYAQFMKRLWSGNRHQIVNENFKTISDVQIR